MTDSEENRGGREPGPGGRFGAPFLRHFLAMLVAMVVGMMVFGLLWQVVVSGLLGSDLLSRTDVGALVMATDMAAGMALWMAYRRHSRAAILEMTTAMYLPFLLLLVPWWAGRLSDGAVMMGGHLLMIPAMLAAMLWRRDEYTRPHHAPAPPASVEVSPATSSDKMPAG